MSRKVSLKDVAREAEISVSSVSKALSGYPQISEATRLKVLAICERLKYPVNDAARRTRGLRRTIQISLLVVESEGLPNTDPQWLSSLSTLAAQQGAILHLGYIRTGSSLEDLEMQRPLCQQADGLIVSGGVDQQLAKRIRDFNRPVVWLTDIMGAHERNPLDSMTLNDTDGMAYRATRELIDRGHRNIGFFCRKHQPGSWNERWRAGYRLALAHHHLPDKQGWRPVLNVANPREVGEAAIEHFRQIDPLPTGWVIPAPLAALRFVNGMQKAGKPVHPDSVIVGGQPHEARALHIEQWAMLSPDFESMAMLAIDRLLRAIVRPALPRCVTLVPARASNLDGLRRL